MKTKKLIPAIIILLCCMLLFTVAVMQIYRKVQFGFRGSQYAVSNSNFHENKQAFEDLVATVSGFYEEARAERSDIKWIEVSQDYEWKVAYGTDPNAFNVYEYTVYKEQSQQDITNFRVISGIFPEKCQGSLFIVVTSDRVVFMKGTGCSIIYMENGKAPKYELRKGAEMDYCYVDKLSSKWYQVIAKYPTT